MPAPRPFEDWNISRFADDDLYKTSGDPAESLVWLFGTSISRACVEKIKKVGGYGAYVQSHSGALGPEVVADLAGFQQHYKGKRIWIVEFGANELKRMWDGGRTPSDLTGPHILRTELGKGLEALQKLERSLEGDLRRGIADTRPHKVFLVGINPQFPTFGFGNNKQREPESSTRVQNVNRCLQRANDKMREFAQEAGWHFLTPRFGGQFIAARDGVHLSAVGCDMDGNPTGGRSNGQGRYAEYIRNQVEKNMPAGFKNK